LPNACAPPHTARDCESAAARQDVRAHDQPANKHTRSTRTDQGPQRPPWGGDGAAGAAASNKRRWVALAASFGAALVALSASRLSASFSLCSSTCAHPCAMEHRSPLEYSSTPRSGWAPCSRRAARRSSARGPSASDARPADGTTRGIPCRAGYRAVRDIMPRGISCRAGYHDAWDIMLRGIP
jgi:hypothetical protein